MLHQRPKLLVVIRGDFRLSRSPLHLVHVGSLTPGGHEATVPPRLPTPLKRDPTRR